MKTSLSHILAACIFLLIATAPAFAAPGDLDLTFGTGGKVSTDFGSSSKGGSVVVQSDGKILVAGYAGDDGVSPLNVDFALARYNANGSMDTTFNGTGQVTTVYGNGVSFDVVSMAVQSDGKILVAGTTGTFPDYDFALVRYNADGSLDATFNGTGKLTTDIGGSYDYGFSVAVQSDGKILVAGYSGGAFALVRYNANGSLDTTFNGTGKVTTYFLFGSSEGRSVAVQSDGKILVAGTSRVNDLDFALVRYNANGSLDTTFNGTGMVITEIGSSIGFSDDEGRSVAVQSDGKILVAGYTSNRSVYPTNFDFALVRYNANGSLDTTFNGTGKVTTDLETVK